MRRCARRAGRGVTILSIVGLVFVAAPSASAHLDWVRDERRIVEDVAVDVAGNTYVTGSFDCELSIEPTCDAFLLKFGPAGRILWKRVWKPEAAHFTRGIDVAVGAGGTVFWAGEVASNDDFGPSSWFLRAVTQNGRLLWHRAQRWRTGFERTYVTDVAVGRDLVALSTIDVCWECSDYEGHQDADVRAFSAGGSSRWTQPFEPLRDVPRSRSELATGIAVDRSDHVYVAGWGAREADGRRSRAGTVVLSKLSSTGARLWSRRVFRLLDPYNGGSPTAHVAARGEHVVLASNARPGTFYRHEPATWVGRYSVEGTRIWSRRWGTDADGAVPTEVAIGGAGKAWVIGTHRDVSGGDLDVFVRTFSPRGVLVRALSKDVKDSDLRGGGLDTNAGVTAFSGQYGRSGKNARIWRYSP